MSDLQLILYDDAVARKWFPFNLTRPAGELWFGTCTLRTRIAEVFGAECDGYIVDAGLADFDEPDAPGALSLARLGRDRNRIFLSTRMVPAGDARAPSAGALTPLLSGNQKVGYFCPAGAANPDEQQLLEPAIEPGVQLPGVVIQHLWQLVTWNTEQIVRDSEQRGGAAAPVPAGVGTIGEPRLILGGNVRIEPGVVLDFTGGPIWLDDDVVVRAFTRLAGPAYIGRGSTVLGGSLSGVSIGPLCKVHGEVEETVILGYTNKAHDGFLGHSYLGRWVNLGAMTTNSDLKNNYGHVRLTMPEGEIATGEMKLGCFLGDHVKTAIGTLLTTGTVAGPGSNLFGAGLPPKFVPPFSWGSGSGAGVYELDRFLATAELAMSRRGVALSEKQRRLLSAAWTRTRALVMEPAV